MTRLKATGLAVVAALLIPVIPTFAEVVPEVTFRGGYTDNLFNDSSSSDDSYTAVSPQLKIYPSSSVELKLGGSYTSYYEFSDLSNFVGNAAITYIPSSKDARLGTILSAGLYTRHYGQIYEPYNNYGIRGRFSFNYDLMKGAIVRGGAFAGLTEYSNSETGDSEKLGFFGVLNFTPYGSNSLNIEAGYNLDRYVTRLDTLSTGDGGGPRQQETVEGHKSNFQTLHYSIRYSRPLGQRIGVSATVIQREFVQEASYVVYGFSVDHLSPWSSLWEGWTVGANIKSFPGRDFIIESGFSYSDKEYVKNLEIFTQDIIINNDTLMISDYVFGQRNDERTRVYLSIQRPFSLKSSKLIRPSIQLSHIDNSSTDGFFEYSYFDISASISFRL
jgi:hypothetical protein